MKLYISSGILLLDCSACHPLHHMYRLQKIPDGTWVCDQDTLSSLVFKRDQLFSYYDGELKDSYAYTLTPGRAMLRTCPKTGTMPYSSVGTRTYAMKCDT